MSFHTILISNIKARRITQSKLAVSLEMSIKMLVLSEIITAKSIITRRPIVIIILCLNFHIQVTNVFAKHKMNFNHKQLEILKYLPVKTDMESFIRKLEKIIQFVQKYPNYVDMNFAFGLYLTSVNLRRVLHMKGENLPKDFKTRLDKLLKINDVVMTYYHKMVQKYDTVSNQRAHEINKLFLDNEISWTNRMQKIGTDLLMKTKFYSKRELVRKYSKWSKYKEIIFEFEKFIPDPETSDTCISALANNTDNPKMKLVHCKIPHRCRRFIINGTDFGYAMTHRLLYLLMARFSRGCYITSLDKQQIDNFCAKIYNEAQYLAIQKFQIPDLFMEQISLCALVGHAQFLRKSWSKQLLNYQSPLGCVGTQPQSENKIVAPDSLYVLERPEWRLLNDDQEILDSMCNSHTTGVAAAMLSAVIRYIMEKFY